MTSHEEVAFSHKIVYSGVSGAIATTCIYPIDITKTRLMNAKGSARLNPVSMFLSIVKNEGLRGLYKGWPPNVLFVMPEKAIKLSANDFFRQKFTAYHRSRHTGQGNPLDLPIHLEMLSGGLAGLLQVVSTNPMELLKIQGAIRQPGSNTSYVQIVRNLGFSGLYTGVFATLLRDIPFSMFYFSIYAKTKLHLSTSTTFSPDNNSYGIDIRPFLSGAVAGTISAALTCPPDVIKTRVHANVVPVKGIAFGQFVSRECSLIKDEFSNLIRKEGASALIKGIIPRCLIISPLFAITMSCYEKFQTYLK
jgi:hypothetical protein